VAPCLKNAKSNLSSRETVLLYELSRGQRDEISRDMGDDKPWEHNSDIS